MKKVQFDYEVWKNHPEREKIKLETSHGDDVTEFTDSYVGKARADKPLIGIVRGVLCTWGLDGMYMNQPALHDLCMILPEERGLYTIMYKNDFGRVLLGPIAGSSDDAFAALEKSGITAMHIYGTYKLVKQ
jgi:hypothetical protein